MVIMICHFLFSAIVHQFLFAITSQQLVHALTTTDIEIQPTSTIAASAAVATGTEHILAVPITAPYNPDLPSNATIEQYLAYDGTLSTSTWNISVTVYSTDSAFDSQLSVSWPAGQGPSPTLSSSQIHWDVCVVYFADLFQHFNASGVTANGTCFDTIGPKCIHYLTTQVQSGDLLKAGCSGVVEVPIPESCSSIYTDMITVNLTTFTSSTLESSSPFIDITDSFDSTNHSVVLSNAMQRIWPIMIVEIGNNGPHPGPIFSPVGCVQALNSTSNNSTTGSTLRASSATMLGTATSTSAAVVSNTATSAAIRFKQLERMNRPLALLAMLMALTPVC